MVQAVTAPAKAKASSKKGGAALDFGLDGEDDFVLKGVGEEEVPGTSQLPVVSFFSALFPLYLCATNMSLHSLTHTHTQLLFHRYLRNGLSKP
jgi:hypothetical protein